MSESALVAICRSMKTAGPWDKATALTNIAEIIDTIYDSEAVSPCRLLREQGVTAVIVELLGQQDAAVHQPALRLIGNLASEAVDTNAMQTKLEFRKLGGFDLLLPHLFSADWVSLVYALGAVQNTCLEADYVLAMQEKGCVARLQARPNPPTRTQPHHKPLPLCGYHCAYFWRIAARGRTVAPSAPPSPTLASSRAVTAPRRNLCVWETNTWRRTRAAA